MGKIGGNKWKGILSEQISKWKETKYRKRKKKGLRKKLAEVFKSKSWRNKKIFCANGLKKIYCFFTKLRILRLIELRKAGCRKFVVV